MMPNNLFSIYFLCYSRQTEWSQAAIINPIYYWFIWRLFFHLIVYTMKCKKNCENKSQFQFTRDQGDVFKWLFLSDQKFKNLKILNLKQRKAKNPRPWEAETSLKND